MCWLWRADLGPVYSEGARPLLAFPVSPMPRLPHQTQRQVFLQRRESLLQGRLLQVSCRINRKLSVYNSRVSLLKNPRHRRMPCERYRIKHISLLKVWCNRWWEFNYLLLTWKVGKTIVEKVVINFVFDIHHRKCYPTKTRVLNVALCIV